jgi:hypothetical protein
MSKEWTADEVRSWMLKLLYDVYMGSPTAIISWKRADFAEATDENPPWEDIFREAEWLDWKGLIEPYFAMGSISAKLKPAGRDFVEKELLKPSSGA